VHTFDNFLGMVLRDDQTACMVADI